MNFRVFRAGLVVAAAAAVLVGCGDGAASLQPLFGTNDLALLQLKPGHWALREPGCEPQTAPGSAAESCNLPLDVSTSQMQLTLPLSKDMPPTSDPKAAAARAANDKLPPMNYLLASGDPMILQITVRNPRQSMAPSDMRQIVIYVVLKPVETAPGNQIRSAELRTVRCEPMAEPNDPPSSGGLFRGMKAWKGQGCAAGSAVAVREAAVASQADSEFATMEWLSESAS